MIHRRTIPSLKPLAVATCLASINCLAWGGIGGTPNSITAAASGTLTTRATPQSGRGSGLALSALRLGALATTEVDLVGLSFELPKPPFSVPENAPVALPPVNDPINPKRTTVQRKFSIATLAGTRIRHQSDQVLNRESGRGRLASGGSYWCQQMWYKPPYLKQVLMMQITWCEISM